VPELLTFATTAYSKDPRISVAGSAKGKAGENDDLNGGVGVF